MNTALVLYMPVLHAGYIALLQSVRPSVVFLVSDELLAAMPEEFDYVRRKDAIRAVPETVMCRVVADVVGHSTLVCLLDCATLPILQTYEKIVMPDEDVCRFLAAQYLVGEDVSFENAFLRWDRQAVLKQEAASVIADRKIDTSELDRLFLRKAEAVALRSADWWRQVGAVLVKGGNVIYTACNQHTPHPQAPYVFGDPRSLFKRGVRIECSTAEHAEAAIIAAAACDGVATKGASLYVTTFPCPGCARSIAHAKIKRCVFSGGYAVLDGADEMRRAGVELLFVETKDPRD